MARLPARPHVVPMRGDYKRTRLDRLGPDGALHIHTWGWAAFVAAPFVFGGVLILLKFGWDGYWQQALAAVFLGVVFAVGVLTLPMWLSRGAGNVMGTALMGANRGRGEDTFSIEESLVMRGLIPEAVERFDARIAQEPEFVGLLMRAAELHAREANDPRRAAELFRRVQSHARATPAESIQASNRLADLYLGPLHDPGRALVELRRIAVQHPETRAAKHALEGIRTIRAQLREG
jgi:hypothetical protein